MTRQQFEELFRCAQKTRDDFVHRMVPWFNHDAHGWPPIVGFGLPSDDHQVPLVTVALNPSNREIEEGHVSALNDVATQWANQTKYFDNPLNWFARSELVLGAAGVGRYRDNAIVHLDLSPQATSGGFDDIYNKKATADEQAKARKFLERGIKETLLPMLRILRAENGTKVVLMYGYVPTRNGAAKRGSRTMKELLGPERLFVGKEHAREGPIVMASGHLNDAHPWAQDAQTLGGMRVVFLSQGPSSHASHANLTAVGSRLRQLGWLCL